MITFHRSPIPPLWTDRPADPYAASKLNRLLERDHRSAVWEVAAQRILLTAEHDIILFCAGTVYAPVHRLRSGDRIELVPIGKGWRDYLMAVPADEAGTSRWVSPDEWGYLTSREVRVWRGPEWADGCLDGGFRIRSADRMGTRLERTGASIEPMDAILSGPVGWGTIQMPPDGHPIVLGPDSGSTGGYPRVGWVDERDLRILGQASAGDLKLTVMSATWI